MSHLSLKYLAAVAAAALLAACGHAHHTTAATSASAVAASSGVIPVVTTISTLDSLVRGVGGDRVRVQSIVPIGASPETYEPTPQDVATIAQARLLVENGAGLETWLDRLLANAAATDLHVVVCSRGLPVKFSNPHLWMDPVYAQHYVDQIRDGLIAVDPTHAAAYRANALAYNRKLQTLARRIARQIATIPPQHRYMIVFHNAWQYYNDRFGITTLGFVERNPGQDPNPEQIARLIDLAKSHGVRAVFSEPEYSPKLVQSIAQGAGVKIVENLYDDSIGTRPQVATYPAMLQYDTNVIVAALK